MRCLGEIRGICHWWQFLQAVKKSQVKKVRCNLSFLGGGSIGCFQWVWRRRGAGWLSRRLCQLSRLLPAWSHQLGLAVPSLKGRRDCLLPSRPAAAPPSTLHILLIRLDSWNPGFHCVLPITCIETMLCVSQVVSRWELSTAVLTRDTGLGVSSSSSAQRETGVSESGCWARLQLLSLPDSGRWPSACPAGFRCGGVTNTGSVVVMLVVVGWESDADGCSPQPGWCPWMAQGNPAQIRPESAAWLRFMQ